MFYLKARKVENTEKRVYCPVFKISFLIYYHKNYKDVYDISQKKGADNADPWKSPDNGHGRDAPYQCGPGP